MKRFGLAAATVLSFASCSTTGPTASPGDGGTSPVADAGATTAASDERLTAILTAEHRRFAGGVTEADQRSRDPTVRRRAARALARIGGDAAIPGLLRALSDEDRETVAWAAYGLGFSCKGHEKESVSAIVARSLTLRDDKSETKPPSSPPLSGPPPSTLAPPDPWFAMARAIGRCAAEESEPTLVAWLAGPAARAADAGLGLGDLSSAKEAAKDKLREDTIVALLNAAAGSAAAAPIPEALFPIGRMEHPPLNVVDRIREVATARLATAGDARLLAVRALGRGGPDAAIDLKRVLEGKGFTPPERAEAAKSLKRLGRAGMIALGETLSGMVPASDPLAATSLVGDDLGVLLGTLDAIDGLANPDPEKAKPIEIPPAAKKTLGDLAVFPVPPQAPPEIARRIAWIRCSAAQAMVGAKYTEKALAGCDVSPDVRSTGDRPADAAKEGMPETTIGARAMIEVIGRAEITGPRLAAYRAYALGGDLRARERAIELLEQHDEVPSLAIVLAALAAKEGGLVGTAADLLSKVPERGAIEVAKAKPKRKKGKHAKDEPPAQAGSEPSPDVVKAVLAAMSRPGMADDPESDDSLIDAAAALASKDALPKLEELCKSPYPTTRDHAAKAINQLTGAKRACPAATDGYDAPAELKSVARTDVELSLDTDAGAMSIRLDAAIAPVMVTRVADLAKAGYYDGMVVHRVVPGFVTQFGAPLGDGFGGPPGKPSLRCETSPIQFTTGVVGVALAGRDTGASQIFVMHASHPHLDGQYAVIGTASGAWAAFVDGDRIRKVTVR